MRDDKGFIVKLRSEGKSYRQIQKITGVSRGTLYKWFQRENWSHEITNKLSDVNPSNSSQRMIRMNLVRNLKYKYSYALVESEAVKSYKNFSQEALFLEGLKIYLKHGDIKTKYLVRISSGIPKKHVIFKQFCQKYLINIDYKIKYQIYSPAECVVIDTLKYWSRELNTPKDSFYKIQSLKLKKISKTLLFGLCVTIISSTSLKKNILKWLELYKIDRNAGMV